MIARWLRTWVQGAATRRQARVLEHRAIPDELWLDTLRLYPFLRWRSTAQLEHLRELSTLFLARKEFTTIQGLELSDEMAVCIAAQACVPIVELGLACYDGFVGIVVSPGEVRAQREWTDDDGVVHSGEEVLSGEAMQGGPVMLSWSDVREAGWTAGDGYNVVIHEFVHVLDMADGRDADGMPPLEDATQRLNWQRVMSDALDQHRIAVEHGDNAAWLDPYAAQGPEEFLAVCAEAFFVAPHELQAAHPTVHALLKAYFKQDPGAFAPG